MTVQTVPSSVTLLGNGATTVWSFPFLVRTLSEIQVTYVDANGNQFIQPVSAFTVSGLGNSGGGQVTYPLSGSPIATGTFVNIQRVTPYIQPTSLANQGAFAPAAVEGGLDNIELQVQQILTQIVYSMREPVVDITPMTPLPTAQQRANQILSFDANGNPQTIYSPNITVFGVSRTVITATAGQTVLNLSANYTPGANVAMVIVNGSTQVSGIDYTESSVSTITMNAPLTVGDTVVVLLGQSLAGGSTSASNVSYAAPGTGSISTTIDKVLNENVSVLRFGADPSGVTDSTAAMQFAHNTGLSIYYPPGTYKFTAITIPGGGIRGAGQYLTNLVCTSTANADAITYTGAFAGEFRDFNISGPLSKAGGSAINVTAGGVGEVSGMRFFHLIFNQFPTHIHFTRASLWTVLACNFYNFFVNGILVDNQNSGDSGDSEIASCQFESNPYPTSFGIQQVSSGGLKIGGCKFNNMSVGYLLNLGTVVGGSGTSILLIGRCSFENCVNSAIQLQRASGTAIFTHVSIVNNEFLMSANNSCGIYSNDTSGFLSNVNVVGNVFFCSTNVGASCVIFDYVTNFLIGSNTLRGSTGGTAIGIIIGTHTTLGKIGINQIAGFQFSINAPVTGANAVAVVKHDVQKVTANVTTSSAYGASLFEGATTLTLPTALCADIAQDIGDVVAVVTSIVGGGISVVVTGINSTQVFVAVIGQTNGGSVPIQCTVRGII